MIAKRFVRILRAQLFQKYLILLLVNKTKTGEDNVLSYIHLNHPNSKIFAKL